MTNRCEIPSSLQEYLHSEGYKKYGDIRFLSDKASLEDPENDPFKSKYEARTLLREILDKVLSERETDPDNLIVCIMEAALRYHIGVNLIQTEERPAGEESLCKCIARLGDEHCLEKEAVSVAVSAFSELGVLWASRYQGSEKSLENLQKAKDLYERYKAKVGCPPFSTDELFVDPKKHLPDDQRETKFEKLHTHILFYIAQAHKHVGNSEKSAEYCHQTLRRQLEAGDYDPLEWSINSACLSQYYITKNMFEQAKHCLVCANVTVREAKPREDLGEPSPDEGEDVRKIRNAIPQTKADIARCWVKYCLALLEYSKEKLYDDVCELDHSKQAEAIDGLRDAAPKMTDADFHHERMPLDVKSEEGKVRHLRVVTYRDSREVFLFGKKYVDVALEYFVMDGYVTDNIELHQDMSSLYKHLAFFEENPENKCKMHKRRIDLLTKVLDDINPKFYLLICRQLQFELGETYGSMLDLKVGIANSTGGNPSIHAVKKINSLSLSGIRYFTEFVDTLKNLEKELPTKFDDDVERPAVVAKFHLARLYSKIIAPEKSDKLVYMRRSLEHYSWIVDYVERNPECERSVQKEVEICKEMVALLPKSMERYTE